MPVAPQTQTPTADALDQSDLRATVAQDRSAFERLYRRHHPRLARYLRHFSTNSALIEEVINDAMWVVWSHAGDFRGDSKVSTWITGIATRRMLKTLRDGKPAQEASLSLPEHADLEGWADPQVDLDAERELHDWVEQGLRLLPADHRMTLELVYRVGLSCEEIGSVMACATGTVKARLSRAREHLRKILPAIGLPGPPDHAACQPKPHGTTGLIK